MAVVLVLLAICMDTICVHTLQYALVFRVSAAHATITLLPVQLTFFPLTSLLES